MQNYFRVLLAGFIGGVSLRSFFDFGWAFAGFFALLGIVLIIVSLMTENRRLTTAIAIFLIAIGLGMARYEIKDSPPDLSWFESATADGRKVEMAGVVADEPDERENYTRIVMVPVSGVKVLVYVQHYPEFRYGDELKISGVLKKPKNLNESFDWQAHLLKDDIYYEIFYPEMEKISEGGGSFIKRELFKIKAKYLSALAKAMPEPHSAFMAGLTVGAKQAIGKELLEDFRKTGIIHIVVLSGYNITLVADIAMRLLGFLPRIFGISLGALGIILFAVMTGASATVVRASAMALLVILARTTGRLYEITWALFLTGFFMVLHNPKILRFDAGFQLSFLATLALIWLAPHIEKKLSFIAKKWKLREIASATLATQIFVLPLLLYKMGLFSAVSVPVNLLILIFVPATMFFGFAAGIIGMFNALISIPFGWVGYVLTQYEIFIVQFFANLPFASFTIKNFPFWLMLMMYAIYGIIIYRLNKMQ